MRFNSELELVKFTVATDQVGLIEGLKEGLICSRGKSSKIIEEISPQKLLYLIFPFFFLGFQP